MLPPALRAAEVNLRHWRRTWRGSAFTNFVQPILFLASLGLGLGSLVDRGGSDQLPVAYAAFAGTGLLTASAFTSAAGECTWPVVVAIRWSRTFHAAVAAPLGVRDLVVGHLLVVALRLTVSALIFAAFMAVFGVASLPRALLGVVPAVVTGTSVAPAVFAFSARVDHEWTLSYLFRFGVIPLFLLSGTFFPVSSLAAWAQPLAWLSPLWHGVELTRLVVLGLAPPVPVAVSLAYLGVWAVAGFTASVAMLTRKLAP